VKSVKVTLHDYIRLLNYFHISTCRWLAADLSTTINFNIIQTRRVIRVECRVESWVITSEFQVESESYRGWDSSRVASHQNVTSRDSSRVASHESTAQLSCDRHIDLLCLTESWCDSDSAVLGRLRISGYKVIDRPRRRCAGAKALRVVCPPRWYRRRRREYFSVTTRLC